MRSSAAAAADRSRPSAASSAPPRRADASTRAHASSSSTAAAITAAAPAPSLDALADQLAHWLCTTMKAEGDSPDAGDDADEADDANDQADQPAAPAAASTPPLLSARDLLPLMRGRMLKAVPMLVARVRPASQVRHIAHNVKLAEAQRAAANAGATGEQQREAAPTGPHHPRQARLDALRAHRDALRRSAAAKESSLCALQADVARAKMELAVEQDALLAARQTHDLDVQRRALRQAFVAEKKQSTAVWQEYAQRMHTHAMLQSAPTQATQQLQQQQQKQQQQPTKQFLSSSKEDGTGGSTEDGVESASQRSLRAAFQLVLQSFEQTFEQAQRDAAEHKLQQEAENRVAIGNDPQQPPQQRGPEYPKLTAEWCAARAELRALFPVPASSSSAASHNGLTSNAAPTSSAATAAAAARFDASAFLRDLTNEVDRSAVQLQRKREAVETEHNATSSATAAPSSSAAAPATPSLQSLLSNLISQLQDESSSRFLQAQKLQNETFVSDQILQELLDKQRAPDARLTSAQGVSFEEQQEVASMRRLQNLQQTLAALRAQLAFAQKTYATFLGIQSVRAQAWERFARQKTELESFATTRRAMEKQMMDLVMHNKIMRNKLGQYDVRLSDYISTQLHPLCALLSDTVRTLVDCVSREHSQGSAAIVSPLSMVEPSRAEGGSGRVPLSRLALHMLQTPTLQLNQLHALLVDPFGGVGSGAGTPGGFKGLVDFPLYHAPSAILAFMNGLVNQATQLALMDRFAAQSWAALAAPPGSNASLLADVMQLSSWSALAAKMRDHRRKRDQEWMPQLRGVSSAASTALSRSLPRLSSLLDDLWYEPAQRCIPHLRNRLGYNIDDYTQQIRSLATQLQQQQQRYERKLQAKRQ